jgi:hypothetical protein
MQVCSLRRLVNVSLYYSLPNRGIFDPYVKYNVCVKLEPSIQIVPPNEEYEQERVCARGSLVLSISNI